MRSFPQRSGELVIPRESLSAPGAGRHLLATASACLPVSESHTITVKTIPEAFSGETWIPASALEVTESWTREAPVFRVGEPRQPTDCHLSHRACQHTAARTGSDSD